MTYPILVEDAVLDFLKVLPEKSQRIIRSKIAHLGDNPYPGKDGDKECFTSRGKDPVYRLHISRSYTAFYRIKDESVYVYDLMTIEKAHKKYGLI
ncbi:MAG: hypothetical protein BWY45_02534 [Euryarchaeota archaeon ADurb.Bin294]|nr:MAG: hypothetical protein BWY45_02534 [Euryarchaeota archaeon ADurb.Bin294]